VEEFRRNIEDDEWLSVLGGPSRLVVVCGGRKWLFTDCVRFFADSEWWCDGFDVLLGEL